MSEEPDLERLAAALAGTPGVVGVVLGGSRARGTHSEASDYDVGIYYAGDEALDVGALSTVVSAFDDEGREGLVEKTQALI